MAGTSEKEQRTVMGLEAAVRVEAEFPTRPGEGREWEKTPGGRGEPLWLRRRAKERT